MTKSQFRFTLDFELNDKEHEFNSRHFAEEIESYLLNYCGLDSKVLNYTNSCPIYKYD